ncbi:MAG TPA: hypothetical protein VL240_07145 [Candidatus Binatia bacterium]|nr:hypothetical protein [Candidatus Binatia bacterium]
MKLGTENRTKTIIAAVLVVVAAVLLVRAFSGGAQNANDSPPVATAPAAVKAGGTAAARKPPRLLAHSLDPTLRFDLLKSSEDVSYKGNGRNIFRSEAPPPDIPRPLPPDKQPGPQAPPPPPPIDLKFYGFAGPRNGAKRIFLLKGEDIFLAKEGDIVDRRYKILHVGPNSVEVQDVLTNNTQTIPLSAG